MAVTLRGDRGAFGAVLTPAQTSPLRLGTLPARATSSALLSVGANGDVAAGALVAADLPAVFTRRDVAETIAASWTWAAGQTITFAAGTLAPPSASARSVGTRLVLQPNAGATEWAIGRETSALWTSVPVGNQHRWYYGATERLRLETDGTLHVVNGSGTVVLNSVPAGDGGLTAMGGLYLNTLAGGLTFSTSNQQILPALGYRENLGALNRKYLSLHAAELWAETLVAQSTMATIGGRILIGPTTSLTRDVAPGDATIYVKHKFFGLHVPSVELGSNLVLESNGKFEVMVVQDQTAPVATTQGDYPYAVARAWGGTANSWYAGDAVFDTGRVGPPTGAFMDLYSVRGVNPGTTAGPTIVGNVRTGGSALAWAERWAIGNLQGLYGNASPVFGAAFGYAAGVHLQVDATYGIRMMNGTSVQYGQWDMSGNVTLGYVTATQILFTAGDGSLRMRVNGADKMALLNDGALYLSSALICGAFAGTTAVVRSANALDWNSGSGFAFKYVQATNLTTALIGNSAGRRVTWDGASLKVISDGLTIDENGIALQQQASGVYSPTRAVQWTGGAYLWDSSVNNAFELQRASGTIQLVALNGTVLLQGGGSGIDRAQINIGSNYIQLQGVVAGGGRPQFQPDTDALWDIGNGSRRFRTAYISGNVNAGYFVGTAANSWITTQYGAFAGAVPNAYYLEVKLDSAGKPASSTWFISPSNRAAKDDVVPVDPVDALALVRRVPVIRYRYNGKLGSPAGERAIGVIAEDVAEVLPDSVKPDMTGLRLGWNAHELFMLNVAAVQALAARLDALERTPRDS